MLPSFMRQSVIRLRPSVKVVRGSEVYDWNDPSELVIGGCSVQPGTTELSQDGRVQGILDGLTAYLPPTADVQAGDRIKYDGKIYTIDGEPKRWIGAVNLSHIQLTLRRWSG